MAEKMPPVSVGERIKAKVVAEGRDEAMIAKVDGFVLIIQNCVCQIGAEVEVEVTKISKKRTSAFAELVDANEAPAEEAKPEAEAKTVEEEKAADAEEEKKEE